jgi:MerR family transcriptional regulator, light-induced transcriptional regulator
MMMQGSTVPAMSIAQLERETGFSEDTLRVWERRYGFPAPLRGANDEHLYPADQAERLYVIRRLMVGGVRPGKIVALPLRELHQWLRSRDRQAVQAGPAGIPAADGAPGEWIQVIRSHDAGALQRRLAPQPAQRGLRQFMLAVVVPPNARVGVEWLRGNIEVFEVHLYAEQVLGLLRQALTHWPPASRAPRLLLTTLPGEAHQLGLLMAQAFLVMEGADCVSLGAQTSVPEIVKAAAVHRADIVGLSRGSTPGLRSALPQLRELRARVEPRMPLWLGGAPSDRAPAELPGITAFPSLLTIPAALGQWRAAHTDAG